MAFRTDMSAKIALGGSLYTLFLVDNPTIDDVMVTEMRMYAAEIELGSPGERRVSKGVRDLLIRLGVER